MSGRDEVDKSKVLFSIESDEDDARYDDKSVCKKYHGKIFHLSFPS